MDLQRITREHYFNGLNGRVTRRFHLREDHSRGEGELGFGATTKCLHGQDAQARTGTDAHQEFPLIPSGDVLGHFSILSHLGEQGEVLPEESRALASDLFQCDGEILRKSVLHSRRTIRSINKTVTTSSWPHGWYRSFIFFSFSTCNFCSSALNLIFLFWLGMEGAKAEVSELEVGAFFCKRELARGSGLTKELGFHPVPSSSSSSSSSLTPKKRAAPFDV